MVIMIMMEERDDETGRNEKKDCEMWKCNRRSDDDDHIMVKGQ